MSLKGDFLIIAGGISILVAVGQLVIEMHPTQPTCKSETICDFWKNKNTHRTYKLTSSEEALISASACFTIAAM